MIFGNWEPCLMEINLALWSPTDCPMALAQVLTTPKLWKNLQRLRIEELVNLLFNGGQCSGIFFWVSCRNAHKMLCKHKLSHIELRQWQLPVIPRFQWPPFICNCHERMPDPAEWLNECRNMYIALSMLRENCSQLPKVCLGAQFGFKSRCRKSGIEYMYAVLGPCVVYFFPSCFNNIRHRLVP